MKVRPIHFLALAICLVIYHFGYIFTRPEMIRKVILAEDSFIRRNDISVDATPIIKEYFKLGMDMEASRKLGESIGMRVGKGPHLNNAEAKQYDGSLAFYQNIHRGFAGWEILTGCDNQVIVSLKFKDNKIADVQGILKKDCVTMP